jgi:hypothetical protein
VKVVLLSLCFNDIHYPLARVPNAVQPNRRNLLATIGGIATGGVAVSLATTEQASAQVQYGNLEIPNREFQQTSQLQAVKINVQARYSFDAEQVPDRWVCELLVEDTIIAEDRMAPSSKADSGTVELEGNVTDAGYSIDDFQLDKEESKQTVALPTTLQFRIEAGEQIIAETSTEATPELTITPGEIEGSVELSGEGEIVLSK